MSEDPHARDERPGTPPLPAHPSPPLAAPVIDLEAARLRAALPAVVSRCMAFSAMPAFDLALIDAVQTFYGVDVDVATAETDILEDDTERVRFFPWFLWEWKSAMHPRTIGARFEAEGLLDADERRLVRALNRSRVWFWEVRAIEEGPHGGVKLRELLGRRTVTVRDPALHDAVRPGDLLLARLLHIRGITGSAIHLIDAVYVALPGAARDGLIERLVGIGLEGGLKVATADPAIAPELMELTEEVLDALHGIAPEPEEALLITARIAPEHAALALTLGRAESGSTAVLQVPGGAKGAHTAVVDRQASGHALCHVVGEDALLAIRDHLERAGVLLAPLHAEQHLDDAVVLWLDRGHVPGFAHHHPEIVAAILRAAGDWAITFPECIHPAFGRRPRDAVKDAWSRPDVESMLEKVERTLPASARHAVSIVRQRLGL